MAVVQLATSDDVAAFLGRDLTVSEETRVEPILDKASELFRKVSGQTFTEDVSEVRLRVRVSQVFLPQKPVVTVESVTDDDGIDLDYVRYKQILTLASGSEQWVRVEYTHGGTVPDLVQLAVAEIGAVVLRIDANALTGASQMAETTGPFSRQATYASWAQGGATRLSPDDVTLARSFRNPWRQNVVLGS